MKHFIKLDSTRSIIIEEIDFDTSTILYRNLGEGFVYRIKEVRNFIIKDNVVNVLTVEGDVNFHFHSDMLDPINGMLRVLAERKIIKLR